MLPDSRLNCRTKLSQYVATLHIHFKLSHYVVTLIAISRHLLQASHKPLRYLSDVSTMEHAYQMPLRCLLHEIRLSYVTSMRRYASQLPRICPLNKINLSDVSQKPSRCLSYTFPMNFQNMKCMILGTHAIRIIYRHSFMYILIVSSYVNVN